MKEREQNKEERERIKERDVRPESLSIRQRNKNCPKSVTQGGDVSVSGVSDDCKKKIGGRAKKGMKIGGVVKLSPFAFFLSAQKRHRHCRDRMCTVYKYRAEFKEKKERGEGG